MPIIVANRCTLGLIVCTDIYFLFYLFGYYFHYLLMLRFLVMHIVIAIHCGISVRTPSVTCHIYYVDCRNGEHIFTARCTVGCRPSAKRGLAIACRPSVRLSAYNVGGSESHKLEILESNIIAGTIIPKPKPTPPSIIVRPILFFIF